MGTQEQWGWEVYRRREKRGRETGEIRFFFFATLHSISQKEKHIEARGRNHCRRGQELGVHGTRSGSVSQILKTILINSL